MLQVKLDIESTEIHIIYAEYRSITTDTSQNLALK